MKLTKAELKQKISDSITDNDDLVISLLEDIEDSMADNDTEQVIDETAKKQLEELQCKYDDLKQKYKERFLTNDNKTEEKEDTQDDDELKEEEVIDIKEI